VTEADELVERLLEPDAWWGEYGGCMPDKARDSAPFQAADLITQLRASVAALEAGLQEAREILEGDITAFPTMEAKAIEVANRISGTCGGPSCHPDPVMLLEWVDEINKAGLSDARALKEQPHAAD